jgi:teichuronic acid biosynthesis glycosyltransferase TuaC
MADMRILTFSTLYPNAVRPNHGVFVETRLRHLLECARVEARVIAPTPWFPSANPRYGRYAALARAPRAEKRHNIDVLHPRYLSLPKIGMSAAPFLLARGALPAVKDMIRRGYDLDIIDAHYFYPDGVAAAMIGRQLGKPVVITARGTDINLLPHYALPRKMILWAAKCAAALITVSSALKTALMQLGVDAGKITVLRNGVDTNLFHPVDRVVERARLGLTGKVLLMVGNLVPLKGHDLVLRALAEFPEARLLVIGEGSEERNLKTLAGALQIQDRVRFLGAMPQQLLPPYYAAADALVLASCREGWPNVLLEAMACGTPVVAVNVGGIPEIVTAPEAGVIMTERSPRGALEALQRLFQNYPDRSSTRRYAERFNWDDTTRGQLALFDRVLNIPAPAGSNG